MTFISSQKRPNILPIQLLSLTILGLIVFGESCTQTVMTEYEGSEPCFTKQSLQTSQWIREELEWFQQPKMGFLRVAVYRYKSDYYLAFENSFVSGPASYIFNCAGQNLGDLQILYNDFCDNAELMAILLTGNY